MIALQAIVHCSVPATPHLMIQLTARLCCQAVEQRLLRTISGRGSQGEGEPRRQQEGGAHLDGDEAQSEGILWGAPGMLGGREALQDARCAHQQLQAAHARGEGRCTRHSCSDLQPQGIVSQALHWKDNQNGDMFVSGTSTWLCRWMGPRQLQCRPRALQGSQSGSTRAHDLQQQQLPISLLMDRVAAHAREHRGLQGL